MREVLFLVILGYLLSTVRGSPQLLFANRKDVRLVDVENPQGNSTIIVSGLEDAAALDFIYTENKVFWTDVSMETIKMAWINDSRKPVDIITKGLVSPDGLACDWLGKKLYWTDSEINRIEVSNLDGSYRKVLFWTNLDQPRAIALDPLHGYMYWTDWGESPRIERAGMDGGDSSRRIIIDTHIYWPNGLTLDYGASRLYWADAKENFIHSCNFDGSDRQQVIGGDGRLPHPFALTLFENNLYWTDWQTQSIHTCNKLTGMGGGEIVGKIYSPMDIHAFHASRQPTGKNPCGENNGGCSHLCLMSPRQPFYSCACPTGVQLLTDGKTCANGASELLLLARRPDIRRISLDTPDYTDVVLQLDNIKHCIAIDYDHVEGYLYWTDDEVQAISRAYLNGTGQEIIIGTEVDMPDGVAVDWIARNLYWTDTGTDRIEVARLNGTSRRVLISEGLEEPRAIALDPVAGYMYWTDWGENPKIERAALDGSDRTVLFNTSLGWPNGIALDFEEHKIYFGDAKTDKIEVANMDGTDRRVIASEDNTPHIFGFSLLGDYIYWTDWQRRSIERINKHTGGDRTIIIEQLPDLMGLKAVDVSMPKGTNGCARDNGGCSHLCLNRPLPKKPVCACPMGWELRADGRTCIVPEAFLLFSHRTDIRRISLEISQNDDAIPLQGVIDASAIDFDINDHRIYWTDVTLKSISRAFMNGSAHEKVIRDGLMWPEGMAVDWVAHNLYWADAGTGRIEMSRMNGSSRRVLIWKDIQPRVLAVHPPRGHLYFSNWGGNTRIERSALDGSYRTHIVNDVDRVIGLTIDFTADRLYWTDVDKLRIESTDLEGQNRLQVVTDLKKPFGLTQYQNYIFWSDWNEKSIQKADKTTGQNRTKIQENLDLIMDISVFHSSRQSGGNACAKDNGGCEHICVAHSSDFDNNTLLYHCECPDHYTVSLDNKTCTAPQSFLLYSQRNQTSRKVFADLPDIVLPIYGLKNIKALTFDPVEDFIYWIDKRTIKRAKDNGAQMSYVVQSSKDNSLRQPYDIDIDPYTGMLYWSDEGQNVINVTRLDGTPVGVVVRPHQQNPRSLVLAPKHGLMFWTNMMIPAKIERSALDGSEYVSILVSPTVRDPGLLAVDEESEKIFWVDTGINTINSANFDGGSMKVLTNTGMKSVVGLAVHGEYLYWLDKGHKMLSRINKLTGAERVMIESRLFNLSDLVAVQKITKEEKNSHPCGVNNGGCSHLCVKEDRAARCSCPYGLELNEDGRLCVDPPTCAPEDFTCLKGNTKCIPLVWQCDGQAECDDGSDEEGCASCPKDQFRCSKSGQCISVDRRCDGKSDCGDGSDEENCPPCTAGQFECKQDRTCIAEKLKCNSDYDCASGEDEVNCAPYTTHTGGKATTTAQYTISITVALVVVLFVAIIVFVICRRKTHQPYEEDIQTIILSSSGKPITGACGGIGISTTPPNTLSSRGKSAAGASHSLGVAKSVTITSSNDSGPPYDRNHVTGASSSSSTVTAYPKETLNPPPSPITDRSQCGAEDNDLYYSSNSPSTVRSFRPHHHHHYHRRRNIPPHNTPYSTDVCEDSEPQYTRPHRHKRPHHHGKYYVLPYDSDPCPPPPTPRSQYLSDEASECPPSPSTERSFFNPLPPPPSPVNASDC